MRFSRHASLRIRIPIQDNGDRGRHFGGGVDKEALPVGGNRVCWGWTVDSGLLPIGFARKSGTAVPASIR